MVQKKADVQKEVNQLLDQAKDKFKKFGKELSVLAKKSEKEIVKASRAGKIQLDIMGLNMQKEKLYYDIGKKVASLNAKKKLDITGLEQFWKKMRNLESAARKRKRALSGVRKENKK